MTRRFGAFCFVLGICPVFAFAQAPASNLEPLTLGRGWSALGADVRTRPSGLPISSLRRGRDRIQPSRSISKHRARPAEGRMRSTVQAVAEWS